MGEMFGARVWIFTKLILIILKCGKVGSLQQGTLTEAEGSVQLTSSY